MFEIEDIKNIYMRGDAHSKYHKEIKSEKTGELLEIILFFQALCKVSAARSYPVANGARIGEKQSLVEG